MLYGKRWSPALLLMPSSAEDFSAIVPRSTPPKGSRSIPGVFIQARCRFLPTEFSGTPAYAGLAGPPTLDYRLTHEWNCLGLEQIAMQTRR